MVTCRRQRFGFCSLCIFLFTAINSVRVLHGHGGMKFELTRWRDSAVSLSQLERTKLRLHGDDIRHRGISERVRVRRGNVRREIEESNVYKPDCENGRSYRRNVSGELPIHSGADYGTGEYFVKIRVGSPPQRVVLIADTASELTWMNCKYKCRGGGCRRNSTKHRVFRGDRSASFKTVPCSSSLCKIDLANLFSLAQCPSPMDPCAYDYRYADGSSTLGLFARETVTFHLSNGWRTRLHNVLVGCSESAQGKILVGSDGVMGLGYSNYSFGVKAAERFGGKFSYCLVDHLSAKNLSSYLIFGSHEQANISLSRMHYTELVVGAYTSFYAVKVRGISIGGSMLEIPAETWNVSGKGGMIVDSGSTLTALTLPAYNPVMDALKQSVSGFKQLDVKIGPLEYCFNSTGFNESMVPRLVVHFEDGARFEPAVKSYVIDVDTGVKCLGFIPADWPGVCVLGNIMQQNNYWEYDLVSSRLGFAASSCT